MLTWNQESDVLLAVQEKCRNEPLQMAAETFPPAPLDAGRGTNSHPRPAPQTRPTGANSSVSSSFLWRGTGRPRRSSSSTAITETPYRPRKPMARTRRINRGVAARKGMTNRKIGCGVDSMRR